MLRAFSSFRRFLKIIRDLWHSRALRRILLLLLALWTFDQCVTLVTEHQWMAATDLAAAWRTQIVAQVMLFCVALLVILGGAFVLLRPLQATPHLAHSVPPAYQTLFGWMISTHRRLVRAAGLAVAVVALLQALRLARSWSDWVFFSHSQAWSIGEPVLGQAADFFVFRLNWWLRVLDVAWTSATVVLILAALLTVTRCTLLLVARELHGALRWLRALRPLFAAAALWFTLRAAGYYLEPFDIAANAAEWGRSNGVGLLLVDRVTSRFGLTACLLMALLCIVPALAVSVTLPANKQVPVFAPGSNRAKKWRAVRWVAGVSLCALLLPALVFRFARLVLGSQPSRQEIAVRNESRQSTAWQRARAQTLRAAWNLDAVQMQTVTVEPKTKVESGNRTSSGATVAPPVPYEVPVWDATRLSAALQARLATATTRDRIEPFDAVQIDRYIRDNQRVLVGIAGRQVPQDLAASDVALFSASQVSREQTPVPIARREALSAKPSDESAASVLPGWQRLLWAWRLRDLSLLHSGDGAAEGEQFTRSNLLFRRSMRVWAQRIAPFLVPDGEPYPVVTSTGVVWMLDLLSATTRFPLVASTQRVGVLQGYNAARDSVKMTRDAQTGQVNFYAAGRDENDPLLEPWRRAYPSLVKPWHEMPAFLRRHCRYPRALFDVQRDALRDTSKAAAGSDAGVASYTLWPANGRREQAHDSRFVLQGTLWQSAVKDVADTAETAILVAHCDEDVYGRLRIYRFQRRRVPEANSGSRLSAVVRREIADLNVGPGEPDAVSAEPIYLPVGALAADGKLKAVAQRLLRVEAQYAAGAGVPRLKQVIVSDALDASHPPGSGTNLERAWRKFWGEDAPARPLSVNELAQQALSTHEKVQSAASAGDWAGFDVHRRKLRDILLELQVRSRQREEVSQAAQAQAEPPLKR